MGLGNIRQRWNLANQVFTSVRERGALRTAQIAAHELIFERKFAADTARIIPSSELDINPEARSRASDYFPSSYLILSEAFAAAELADTGEVLVDYGCGMGRALLFASTLPLARIIGVEVSAVLCETARGNLTEYYAHERKTDPAWTVINADARTFEVPNDATVFYFFNPFDASVLTRVAENIRGSIQRAPRRCTVIYANAVHDEVFVTQGFRRARADAHDFAIFNYGP